MIKQPGRACGKTLAYAGLLNFLGLCAAVPSVCCRAAEQEKEHHFQAEIVALDPTRHTLRVRHKPTGYEVELWWDEKTRFSSQQRRDIDAIPAGWVQVWAPEIDAEKCVVLSPGRLDVVTGEPAPRAPVAKSSFPAKLVREPLAPGATPPTNTWLTKAKDAAYYLEVQGRRWTIKPGKRPRFDQIDALTNEQIKQQIKLGLGLRDMTYIEGANGNRLRSAVAFLGAEKSEHALGHASGTTCEILDKELSEIRGAYQKVAAELRRTVKFRVSPELAMVGEPVNVVAEVWSSTPPTAELALERAYLRPGESRQEKLELPWQAGEKEGGLTHYTAELKLPELPVGQHLVSWKSNVGGDIPEFWRSFAVADKETLVWKIQFTAGTPNVELEEFRLPYDYWEEAAMRLLGGPMGSRKRPASAAEWIKPSREFRRRGAMPSTHIIQANYAGRTGWPAPFPVQFCTEPVEVQKKVIAAACELMPMIGFRREDIGFTSYEFSTETVNAALADDVHLIGSMCIHQNWQDGSWGINHTARPLRPYFSARDDFRKAGPGGPGGIVMTSQHDKSILWTEYGLGVFEPAWLDRAWVGGGGGGRDGVIDDLFMSRHLDLVHASLENVVNQSVPYIGSIGLEFSRPDPEHLETKSNGLLLRYLVQQARGAKVVFTQQAAVADFYRRHYSETPETLFYDADFWAGMKANNCISDSWKPVDYPDLVHIENARYSAYFKRPATLPEYHWDYTKAWNYPNWGNESLPRNQIGVLVPGEHDKFAVTPKITDTREMKLNIRRAERANGIEVFVSLDTPGDMASLPLALWDLPREWKAGDGWWTVRGAKRFVPICAPYTGNLNGILEIDAKAGHNEYSLLIQTPPRTLRSQDIQLPTLHAKVFTREGRSMAYLWPTRPWETSFELVVPQGKSVQFIAAPKGDIVELTPGVNRLVLSQETWARVVGLSRAELLAALRDAPK